MSELRSVIDELRAEDVASLPDARIEEDFAELHRSLEQLEAERLRRLDELSRRRPFERDGHLSAASWLVATFNASWTAARESVRLAAALARMPLARKALEQGTISLRAVRELSRAFESEPEAFASSEEHLVELATAHPVADLRRIVSLWREGLERDRGTDPEERVRQRRSLHASKTFEGMVRVDGDLDPENGELLLTALRAVIDAESRSGTEHEDPRTPAQKRADALGEVCRGWLDLSERPTLAGERPHVVITVPVGTLVGEDTLAELDHLGPVAQSTARRLSCDASVRRVVLGPSSEPLDVGRRTHVVPPSLRRAVAVRDRGCRFPGCGRPHLWCDAHHVTHWADGGPTSIGNLVLLCRPHHRLIHRPGGFGLEGRPVFRRPDGSVLGEDRAPP